MNSFSIDLANIEADGRTTVMIRNIPNKYTEGLLLELFNKNHKKKIDFFYLPIDYKVLFLSFSRIIAMLAMLFSTSSIPGSSSTFTLNFTTKSGNFSTPKKSAISATPASRAPTNFLITLRLPNVGNHRCEWKVFFDFLFLIQPKTLPHPQILINPKYETENKYFTKIK